MDDELGWTNPAPDAAAGAGAGKHATITLRHRGQVGLPPLPKGAVIWHPSYPAAYTERQMQDYAAEAITSLTAERAALIHDLKRQMAIANEKTGECEQLKAIAQGYRLDAEEAEAEHGRLRGALVALVEEHILRGPFDEPLGASEQSEVINNARAALSGSRGDTEGGGE